MDVFCERWIQVGLLVLSSDVSNGIAAIKLPRYKNFLHAIQSLKGTQVKF